MEKHFTNTATIKFSYQRLILYGIVTELLLIALQFVYIRIYSGPNNFVFNDNYMRYEGFYIFQLIGFFLYVTATYWLSNRIHKDLFIHIAVFVIAGCLLEFAFYFIIQAKWQGVFLYSVLSKLIAGVFGIVISLYSSTK